MQAKLSRCAALLLCALMAAVAFAQGASERTVAVYPFASQDVLVGVAVADRLATALESQLDVLGPAVTPAFVPPLMAGEGFISPLDLLRSAPQSGQVADRVGVTLLRSTLGVDVAIAGEISFTESGLALELFVADREETDRYLLSAPQDRPGLLASKALAVVAARLDTPRPETRTAIDLSGPYGDYVSALSLLSGGFLDEARAALARALEAEDNPRWRELQENLSALSVGESGSLPVLQAAASLSLPSFDTSLIREYFEALPDYPFKDSWLAMLAVSQGDEAAARAAFERAADYPYGQAARAVYRAINQAEGAQVDLEALQGGSDLGGLLGAALAANQLGEVALEREILTRLTKVAPTFVYPFERLSFIAFDEAEPLAAAQALAVAVRLEPESDLYWTNLGWAYYLLGLLEQSEAASTKAIAFDPSQHIAWFNLGLARAVTGRLEAAMEAYNQALTLDPEVNDEAVEDLENALERYPEQAAVHFALATLYEQEGQREAAAEQYGRYLDESEGVVPDFERQARQRAEVLLAPPPPIAIDEGIRLSLGANVEGVTPFHPGDRIYPTFELYTPGFELPNEVVVRLGLRSESGEPVGDADLSQQFRIPNNTVALLIDELGLDLPADLPPGRYQLSVTVSAEPDRRASARAPFTVAGEPSLTRQLLSRDISLRAVGTGAALVSPSDLSAEDGDARLVDRLLEELRLTAVSAGEVLPEITQGRFQGLSGDQLFTQSTAEDVRDFLQYLLTQGGAGNMAFTFADAYAQWALEGAPTE